MRIRQSIILCGFVFVTASLASGQVIEDRKSLKGLAGIGIWYRLEQDKLKEINLSPSQLSTDTTLRLRKAGIRVLEGKQEEDSAKGYPHLTVGISLMKSEMRIWVFHLTVTLSEWVFLARDASDSHYLTTWNNSGILGLASEEDIQDTIRKALGEALDKFINDYLAANPPKPAR